jgi:hypothetical protein
MIQTLKLYNFLAVNALNIQFQPLQGFNVKSIAERVMFAAAK